MSELQGILDREARRVSAEPGALDAVLHRVDRRRRNRRVATAIFALALAALALSTLLRVFERSEPQPAPPPKITEENIGDLRMAWNAAPGGCCPVPTASGDTVYVGWNDGITAYPAYCSTGGGTCEPLWVGTVKDVVHRPVTTAVEYKADHLEVVVGDGMVFGIDRRHLYAFPVDCATGGATCQPSWFVTLPFPSYPVIADGMVIVGTGDGHLFGYPTHCGTGAATCEPTWVAHGNGQPSVNGGVVYGVDFRHIFAYPLDCGDRAMDCSPSWSGDLPRFANCCWSGPVAEDGEVYVAAGNRLYGFAESCGTGGETCQPDWIGATGEYGGGIVTLAVDHGMVFASSTLGGEHYAGSGHIYAFTTACGRPVCRPVWSVGLGADAYLTARDGLLFVASHGGFLAAYLERCDHEPAGCKPVWTVATFDQGAPYRPPSVTDRGVFSGADASRFYAFTVPKRQG